MDLLNVLSILIGILGVIIPLIIRSYDININTSKYKFTKVNRNKYSFVFKDRPQTINILYGNLNNKKWLEKYNKNTLIILGSNERFKDMCIVRNSGALGTFINTIIPGQSEVIQQNIYNVASKKFRNSRGHNIGKWIEFGQEINSNGKLDFLVGIVAVTQFKNKIVKAYSSNIINAFRGIHEMANIYHPQEIYMPLLGSGEGGVSPQLSLLCLLISSFEEIGREDGHNFKDINIVIFEDSKQKASISRKRIKLIARLISTIF